MLEKYLIGIWGVFCCIAGGFASGIDVQDVDNGEEIIDKLKKQLIVPEPSNEYKEMVDEIFLISCNRKFIDKEFTSFGDFFWKEIKKLSKNKEGKKLLTTLHMQLKSQNKTISINFSENNSAFYVSSNSAMQIDLNVIDKTVWHTEFGLCKWVPVTYKYNRSKNSVTIMRAADPFYLTIAHELIHAVHFLVEEQNYRIRTTVYNYSNENFTKDVCEETRNAEHEHLGQNAEELITVIGDKLSEKTIRMADNLPMRYIYQDAWRVVAEKAEVLKKCMCKDEIKQVEEYVNSQDKAYFDNNKIFPIISIECYQLLWNKNPLSNSDVVKGTFGNTENNDNGIQEKKELLKIIEGINGKNKEKMLNKVVGNLGIPTIYGNILKQYITDKQLLGIKRKDLATTETREKFIAALKLIKDKLRSDINTTEK